MPGPERHLAAILSADIAGYSRLMAEDETIRLVTARRRPFAVARKLGYWVFRAPDAQRMNEVLPWKPPDEHEPAYT